MAHRLVYLAPVAKAHLNLGRVHIHIHPQRVDGDEQHPAGLAAAVQHVLIGRACAVADQSVTHIAAVDIGILLVAAAARGIGQAGAALHPHRAQGQFQRPALGDERFAQHVGDALIGTGAAPLCHQLAVMPHGKTDTGSHQGMSTHGLQAMRQFGGVGLQELAACRGGKKQLTHFHTGAGGACGWLQLTTAGVQPAGMGGVGGAAGQAELGDRRDGGQRLATKPHRAHRFQLGQIGDLAGGVALHGQGQLAGRDAVAVVLDHDAAHAASHQTHGDLRGTGVQRVVDQLPHHRGGPLDHLAGGDLADELVGQGQDAARGGGQGHAAIIWGGHGRPG